jgi:hypothetical protein
LLKDLITPQNANVFVGKLGDILEKAVDNGPCGPYTLKQLVAV